MGLTRRYVKWTRQWSRFLKFQTTTIKLINLNSNISDCIIFIFIILYILLLCLITIQVRLLIFVFISDWFWIYNIWSIWWLRLFFIYDLVLIGVKIWIKVITFIWLFKLTIKLQRFFILIKFPSQTI